MKTILFLSLFFTTIYAQHSESSLKILIIGKVAKYITWQESHHKNFIITVLKNRDNNIFDTTYHNRKIKHKPVIIKYIDDIKKLTKTDILYISSLNSKDLSKILQYIEGKNIFTVSDIRGFAEKGGMMQIYFASQRVKLKINLDVTQQEHFKIKSSLLRIANVLRGDSTNE